MTILVRRLAVDDGDLADVAAGLNRPDSETSLKSFTAGSLQRFLADPLRFYLVALVDGELAGALHGYCHIHPAGETYVFVDEVDTLISFRRRGVATAMLREAKVLAGEYGASAMWVGTEHDNGAAIDLYRSLGPAEIEAGPIFTYSISR